MKKTVLIGLCLLSFLTTGFAYSATVSQLEVQVRKLNNQVQYLIGQSQENSGGHLNTTIDDLRGQVEVNSHQINQNVKNADLKIAVLEKEVADLKAALSQKPAVNSNSGDMDQKSETLFQQGMTALSAKEYTTASGIFQRYQANYPVGNHASESMYLRAQIALAVGNPKLAKERFKKLLATYPRSAKAPDTYLNLGLIASALGETKSAETYFNKVVSSYPKSLAAAKARAELK